MTSTTKAALLAASFAIPFMMAGAAQAQMGFFGNYYYSDGSQQRSGVAGAAPNILATANGVRCSYRYVVNGGLRIRHEVCE